VLKRRVCERAMSTAPLLLLCLSAAAVGSDGSVGGSVNDWLHPGPDGGDPFLQFPQGETQREALMRSHSAVTFIRPPSSLLVCLQGLHFLVLLIFRPISLSPFCSAAPFWPYQGNECLPLEPTSLSVGDHRARNDCPTKMCSPQKGHLRKRLRGMGLIEAAR